MQKQAVKLPSFISDLDKNEILPKKSYTPALPADIIEFTA